MTISLGYNSEILFKDGSSFCNQGGLITSPQGSTGMIPGKITIDSGYHPLNWCTEMSDIIFKDSVKLVLEEKAVLEIPGSTVLHFTGYQTGLIMNPNSKLILGKGSKILFDNSATLIANNAEFCSSDSSEKWEGIVLSNSGVDSIIGCTFSNAKTQVLNTNCAINSYENRV